MLEQLKEILGESYTEDIGKAIMAAVGKNFVSRADFNEVNEAKKNLEADIKERNKQLEDLKKSEGDTEALKEQIAALQEQNKAQEKENAEAIKALKIETAVEMALAGAKAKNVKAVKALLNLDGAELAEDGTVKGLKDQIEALVKSEESSFLFDTTEPKNNFTGMQPAEGANGATGKAADPGTKQPKDMTYDELCAYLQNNPTVTLD